MRNMSQHRARRTSERLTGGRSNKIMFPDPLRAFQRVVQAGSIRKASEQLSVAPSSVSRQVAILERQMGTALFRRSVGGLTLTHAGQLVAEYADGVIGGFDALRTDLNDLRGSARLVTIAMVESVASQGPTQAMMAFRETFANVSFDLNIIPAPMVIEAVRSQQCDIGIGFNMKLDPLIVRVAQIPEPVMAIMPAGHPLADRESLVLSDISAEPIALPHRDFGFRQMFDRICADEQLAIRAVLQTNCFESLREFAISGAGVTILPRRAAWRYWNSGAIAMVPLAHDAFSESTLDLMMLKQQRIPRVTRLFARCLEENLIITGSLESESAPAKLA
jgi:DNA-binding transcriptional LysR family regulator